MSDVRVRPFRRGDRDQLTRLVNAHAEAVVPGMSVSVNTVLGSLERQPGEFIVDPWVSERVTLVVEQRNRIAAAAHLLRYYPDDRAVASDVALEGWRRELDRLLPAGLADGPDPHRSSDTHRHRLELPAGDHRFVGWREQRGQ